MNEDAPIASQWPHNVRGPAFYLGAFRVSAAKLPDGGEGSGTTVTALGDAAASPLLTTLARSVIQLEAARSLEEPFHRALIDAAIASLRSALLLCGAVPKDITHALRTAAAEFSGTAGDRVASRPNGIPSSIEN